MESVLALVLWALTLWMHPTNSISLDLPVAAEWGTPNGGVADSYPGRDGVCHLRFNRSLWESSADELRRLITLHEVGHCLGFWEADMHAGDGIMGCGYNPEAWCAITAFDRFRVSALHPAPVTPRVFIPMVSR
jgi:hypothetical protein